MSTVTTSPSWATQAIRGTIATVLASLGRHLNRWIAAVIAEQERRAGIDALRRLSDRELKDIGLSRGGVDAALAENASERMRRLSCLQQWRS
jgi:uncharacterized protein YjiS (DUF1127 family)